MSYFSVAWFVEEDSYTCVYAVPEGIHLNDSIEFIESDVRKRNPGAEDISIVSVELVILQPTIF